MIRLEFQKYDRGDKLFVVTMVKEDSRLISMSSMRLDQYETGYGTVQGETNFDPIVIEPKKVRFGGDTLTCYPFIILENRKATAKSRMYLNAVRKLTHWDMWDQRANDELWVYRNNRDEGPNRLIIADEEIVEARLYDLSSNVIRVHPRCFDSRGYWHPAYEYLAREGDYESLR